MGIWPTCSAYLYTVKCIFTRMVYTRTRIYWIWNVYWFYSFWEFCQFSLLRITKIYFAFEGWFLSRVYSIWSFRLYVDIQYILYIQYIRREQYIRYTYILQSHIYSMFTHPTCILKTRLPILGMDFDPFAFPGSAPPYTTNGQSVSSSRNF